MSRTTTSGESDRAISECLPGTSQALHPSLTHVGVDIHMLNVLPGWAYPHCHGPLPFAPFEDGEDPGVGEFPVVLAADLSQIGGALSFSASLPDQCLDLCRDRRRNTPGTEPSRPTRRSGGRPHFFYRRLLPVRSGSRPAYEGSHQIMDRSFSSCQQLNRIRPQCEDQSVGFFRLTHFRVVLLPHPCHITADM